LYEREFFKEIEIQECVLEDFGVLWRNRLLSLGMESGWHGYGKEAGY